MKTEKEVREKYEEMLKHTELLMDKLNNPDKYDDVNMENIQEYINSSYEQNHLNAYCIIRRIYYYLIFYIH